MLEFGYSRSWVCSPVQEITIRRESGWWEPRDLPVLTEEELATVPDNFRCYVCGELKGRKKHFGGHLLEQRVCSGCYPWVDEQTIGGLIRWDERHSYGRYIRE